LKTIFWKRVILNKEKDKDFIWMKVNDEKIDQKEIEERFFDPRSMKAPASSTETK